MTNVPTDAHLDLLLLDADPADVVRLRDLADADGARGLRDAITGTPARPAGPHRRRRLVAVALAVAAAVAAPSAVAVLSPTSSPPSAYAAPVVRFAEQSPRLLMSADGWRVTDANQTYEDAGSMTFGSAGETIDIDWNSPAHSMDPDDGVTNAESVEIDGHPAHVGMATGSGPAYFWAWWSVGDQGVRAAGHFSDLATFTRLVTTLHHVDATTWLDAMPRYVVSPAARRATVEQMLADIPQPPDFDPSTFETTTLILDRYQLGARLTSAVSCGWVKLWFHGSPGEQVRAAAAMGTSRQWAILREMASEGAWSDVLWEVADYLNGTPSNDFVPGPGQTVEELVENHAC